MTFAEKLSDLRKTEKLSQEELAEKLNISRQAVSRWEMGTAMPDANNLVQISRLFNVSIDYLLKEEYTKEMCNGQSDIHNHIQICKKLKPKYFLIIYLLGLLIFPSLYFFIFDGKLIFFSIFKALFSGGFEAAGVISLFIGFTRIYLTVLIIITIVLFLCKKIK